MIKSCFDTVKRLPFLLALVQVPLSVAEDTGTPITIGERINFPSWVMEETRELLIYKPPGYDHSDKRYHLLYLLDGNRFTLHTLLSRPGSHTGILSLETGDGGESTDQGRRRIIFGDEIRGTKKPAICELADIWVLILRAQAGGPYSHSIVAGGLLDTS